MIFIQHSRAHTEAQRGAAHQAAGCAGLKPPHVTEVAATDSAGIETGIEAQPDNRAKDADS